MTKKNNTLYFHSASPPQIVYDEDYIIKLDDSDNDTNPPQIIEDKASQNYMYQMYILYYQPKKLTEDNKYKLILKKKRFLFYKLKVGKDNRKIEFIKKSLKSRFSNYLYRSTKFDKQKIIEEGGFLSKKFWKNNILFGDADTYLNTTNLIEFIRDDPDLRKCIQPSKKIKKVLNEKQLIQAKKNLKQKIVEEPPKQDQEDDTKMEEKPQQKTQKDDTKLEEKPQQETQKEIV